MKTDTSYTIDNKLKNLKNAVLEQASVVDEDARKELFRRRLNDMAGMACSVALRKQYARDPSSIQNLAYRDWDHVVKTSTLRAWNDRNGWPEIKPSVLDARTSEPSSPQIHKT